MTSAPARRIVPLLPDLEQAARFLKCLDPNARSWTFQTFDDSPRKDPTLKRVLHGSLDACALELADLQRRGAGVYVTVNETDGRGRKAQNIVRPRAVWCECDEGADSITFPLPPSIEVQTSEGRRHFYWVSDDLDRDEHAGIMATMIAKHGSDPKAAGIERVLRVPGFWNLKRERPEMVQLLTCDFAEMLGPYRAAELRKAFPPMPVAIRTPRQAAGGEIQAGVELDTPAAIEAASAYLRNAPPAIEGSGGDAHTIAVANDAMDHPISPETCLDLMLELWNDRCVPPWDDAELEGKVQSAARTRQTPIGSLAARDDIFDVVQDLEPVPAPAPASASGLLVFNADVSLAEIVDRQSRQLVRGLIGPGEIGLLYGDPGAGKTFLALDIAYHLALGKSWHGHKVTRAPVLYVSLEGNGNFDKRTLAAAATHGDPGRWFARLRPTVSLAREGGAEGLKTVVAAAGALSEAAGEPCRLIVVDTLARAMAGDDENSTQDMSHFIEKRASEIARQTGATVLIAHHKNKDGGVRGSGVLTGDTDFVLRADHDRKSGTRELHGQKVKDGIEGKLFSFSLNSVTLGTDDEGQPVTSCTIAVAPESKAAAFANSVVRAEQLLSEAISSGRNLSPSAKARGDRYAARWLATELACRLDEAEEIIRHLERGAGFLKVETYRNNGDPAYRYTLARDAIFGVDLNLSAPAAGSCTSPAHPIPCTSCTSLHIPQHVQEPVTAGVSEVPAHPNPCT